MALFAVSSGEAQIRWDAAQQAFFLPVHNDSGVMVEVRLVPANLVRATVRARVESLAAGIYRYHYEFQVPDISPQGLSTARVLCPSLGGPNNLLFSSGQQDPAPSPFAEVRQMFRGTRVCEFTTNVGRGHSSRGQFDSPALPGLGELVLVGDGSVGRWPTSDATVETAAYTAFVDSVLGLTANGVAVRVLGITPVVAPPASGDASGSAAGLGEQVGELCSRTDWISPRGVCQSLTTKARQVQASVARENWAAARGSLGSLAQELGAQDGRHVAPEAVALLSIWIGRVWADLATH